MVDKPVASFVNPYLTQIYENGHYKFEYTVHDFGGEMEFRQFGFIFRNVNEFPMRHLAGERS